MKEACESAIAEIDQILSYRHSAEFKTTLRHIRRQLQKAVDYQPRVELPAETWIRKQSTTEI